MVVFEKVINICDESGKMQEFCLFTENIHKIAKCDKESCEIKTFLTDLTKNLFNEELTYDKRTKFFIHHSIENIAVFNAMYNLQLKGKENIERIDHLIQNSEEVIQKQKENEEELNKFLSQKHLIQK